ncbi:multidrug resistance outer membrane protein [Escherichia coli]|uniref:Multidrug resistance outer membrane protein n=1 Tax=Escherichia coli TaxID=562 RepID=A0A377E839_ECOLX|nr:multidrug resistance outer membrane protein [Escherichia coli]
MINRQLSRLLLCSILGSTTLISGCALVRKDSAPHQQLKTGTNQTGRRYSSCQLRLAAGAVVETTQ